LYQTIPCRQFQVKFFFSALWFGKDFHLKRLFLKLFQKSPPLWKSYPVNTLSPSRKLLLKKIASEGENSHRVNVSCEKSLFLQKDILITPTW
jgi:hypothetical protein